MIFSNDPLGHLSDLVNKAKSIGADAADAIYVEGVSVSTACRKGQPESLSRSEGYDLGLRVFIGKRQAIVSSSDLSNKALDDLIARAVAMAKVVPEDPYCGLAPSEHLATEIRDLDGFDPVEPSGEVLEQRTREAEEAALEIAGVTNSEGAEAGWGRSSVALAGTNGFAQRREGSGHSLSVSVVAGKGTGMERDYDFSTAVYGEDLQNAHELGKNAAKKAVARLTPKKIKTAQVPVIFDPRVSNSLVGHLASAVNGSSVARGTTFLKNKLGEQLFANGINIIDDPLRIRGLRSKAFDAEGVATQTRHIIEDGILQTWVMDMRSARQLGLKTTGNASRGTSSPPSPSTTNLYMESGEVSRDSLIKSVKSGFYVTELIGMGVNGITGDYSRGSGGFWIENGEIAFPVNEVTRAGMLLDIFQNLTPADDLVFQFGTNAPTVRVDGLTVAGK